MKTLDKLKIGESGRVVAVKGSNEQFRRRLIDMGIIPGTIIKLCKKAPLGDPIEINLRSYQLTLRIADCKDIEMEVLS